MCLHAGGFTTAKGQGRCFSSSSEEGGEDATGAGAVSAESRDEGKLEEGGEDAAPELEVAAEEDPSPETESAYDDGEDHDDAEEDIESDIEEDDVMELAALKPKEIVAQLDKYIVGQQSAKKAVALALRNRWRRKQLSADLIDEVIPKNMLMIGPTGCGKTEVARRLAKLAYAPFIKVEATKYTEIGFHGRDVDSIIRDLMEASMLLMRQRKKAKLKKTIDRNVENRILAALIGKGGNKRSKKEFREYYRKGELDDQVVKIEVPIKEPDIGNLAGNHNPVNSTIMINLNKAMLGQNRKSEKRKMLIKDCRPIIEEMEEELLVNTDDVTKDALEAVQQDGIVFLDEIDKICSTNDRHSADASAEGVQRDLLPLIEGSTVNTKHGNVETDHILFICSGAFHSCKPSDLLAELQGRLPIRVELKGLTEEDFYRILTEPVTNLIRQQVELMETENIKLSFTECAIKEIAKVAAEVNTSVENIGARRLHTIVEKVMEDVSYDAPEMEADTAVNVDKEFVRAKVGELLKITDLQKFIL